MFDIFNYRLDFFMLGVTIAFILLDQITGILKAFKAKNISSAKLRDGLFHFMAYMLTLAFCALIDIAEIHADLGFEVPVFQGMCVVIILIQCVSILENLGELAPPLKNQKFMQIFEHILTTDEQEAKINGAAHKKDSRAGARPADTEVSRDSLNGQPGGDGC